ncbi:MAG TPA: anti-sigma factor [Pyrinomonadaceae bacterium]|nr:anti-sigma factor [Pyrinomonadaceae bacterium]
MNGNNEEIMLDLLCKKAVYGLTEQEQQQLADLQREAGVADDSASFERAVAAINLAELGTPDEMPESLRSRILVDAERHFGTSAERTVVPVAETSSGSNWFGWLGWAFAAAAIAIAANLYYTRVPAPMVQQQNPTPTPEEKLSPQQMRQRLIDTAPDLARGSWGAGNVKEVAPAGDIVWSDSKQAGYMRLSGLPVNDPGKEVYQLWIFDETQDPKTPIDGGTFTVNANGEVVIPIDAKLPPKNTSMYAITVEKAPGVTVSKREKIVALAKRET